MSKLDGSILLVLVTLAVLLTSRPVCAQTANLADPVELRGRVLARQKYQFTMEQEGREQVVRPARQATFALRLNKPVFHWAGKEVLVQPASPADEADAAEIGAKRVGFRLPGDSLYLIARFRTAAQMKRVMKANEPRINHYLLTGGPVEPHWPREDELFIAGRLEIPDDHPPEEQAVTLAVGERTTTIRLGFRTATLDGFHIGDLQPGSTDVLVIGQRDPDSGDVVADRVLFEPRLPGPGSQP